jgi:hypothetical protein
LQLTHNRRPARHGGEKAGRDRDAGGGVQRKSEEQPQLDWRLCDDRTHISVIDAGSIGSVPSGRAQSRTDFDAPAPAVAGTSTSGSHNARRNFCVATILGRDRFEFCSPRGQFTRRCKSVFWQLVREKSLVPKCLGIGRNPPDNSKGIFQNDSVISGCGRTADIPAG